MTKIFLTRHGETEWNLQKRMQGNSDSELSSLGRKQAEWLSKRLSRVCFEAIYSSPLKRALETTKLICNNKNTKINIHNDLKEMSFGNWEGKKESEIKNNYPNEYKQFWEEPHLYNRESGETFKEVENRVIPFIENIISNHQNNVLIVTHTVIIKIIMAYFDQRKLHNLWDPPYIHQTCLNIIKTNENNNEILLHGDISHYKNHTRS